MLGQAMRSPVQSASSMKRPFRPEPIDLHALEDGATLAALTSRSSSRPCTANAGREELIGMVHRERAQRTQMEEAMQGLQEELADLREEQEVIQRALRERTDAAKKVERDVRLQTVIFRQQREKQQSACNELARRLVEARREVTATVPEQQTSGVQSAGDAAVGHSQKQPPAEAFEGLRHRLLDLLSTGGSTTWTPRQEAAPALAPPAQAPPVPQAAAAPVPAPEILALGGAARSTLKLASLTGNASTKAAEDIAAATVGAEPVLSSGQLAPVAESDEESATQAKAEATTTASAELAASDRQLAPDAARDGEQTAQASVAADATAPSDEQLVLTSEHADEPVAQADAAGSVELALPDRQLAPILEHNGELIAQADAVASTIAEPPLAAAQLAPVAESGLELNAQASVAADATAPPDEQLVLTSEHADEPIAQADAAGGVELALPDRQLAPILEHDGELTAQADAVASTIAEPPLAAAQLAPVAESGLELNAQASVAVAANVPSNDELALASGHADEPLAQADAATSANVEPALLGRQLAPISENDEELTAQAPAPTEDVGARELQPGEPANAGVEGAAFDGQRALADEHVEEPTAQADSATAITAEPALSNAQLAPVFECEEELAAAVEELGPASDSSTQTDPNWLMVEGIGGEVIDINADLFAEVVDEVPESARTIAVQASVEAVVQTAKVEEGSLPDLEPQMLQDEEGQAPQEGPPHVESPGRPAAGPAEAKGEVALVDGCCVEAPLASARSVSMPPVASQTGAAAAQLLELQEPEEEDTTGSCTSARVLSSCRGGMQEASTAAPSDVASVKSPCGAEALAGEAEVAPLAPEPPCAAAASARSTAASSRSSAGGAGCTMEGFWREPSECGDSEDEDTAEKVLSKGSEGLGSSDSEEDSEDDDSSEEDSEDSEAESEDEEGEEDEEAENAKEEPKAAIAMDIKQAQSDSEEPRLHNEGPVSDVAHEISTEAMWRSTVLKPVIPSPGKAPKDAGVDALAPLREVLNRRHREGNATVAPPFEVAQPQARMPDAGSLIVPPRSFDVPSHRGSANTSARSRAPPSAGGSSHRSCSREAAGRSMPRAASEGRLAQLPPQTKAAAAAPLVYGRPPIDSLRKQAQDIVKLRSRPGAMPEEPLPPQGPSPQEQARLGGGRGPAPPAPSGGRMPPPAAATGARLGPGALPPRGPESKYNNPGSDAWEYDKASIPVPGRMLKGGSAPQANAGGKGTRSQHRLAVAGRAHVKMGALNGVYGRLSVERSVPRVQSLPAISAGRGLTPVYCDSQAAYLHGSPQRHLDCHVR